ncbi:MAG: cation:proton antiporter, partial [Hyphomicrobiales bacterium]|nr:cation:proton antiporter [Hyphomicrobiales bacterium]
LIPPSTRLQGIFFWDLIIYLIEGFVFLLTGLQARTLIEQTQGFSLRELLIATAWTTLIVIVARFAWMLPGAYVPRWLIPSIRRREPSPPWQGPFFLAFTGIRGVVSLAAALAIPYFTASGKAFPHRDMILFITFGVIIATLVGQGLLLPWVVQWLGLSKLGKQEHAEEIKRELHARQAALNEVTKRLDKAIADHELPQFVVDHLRTRNKSRFQVIPSNLTDDLALVRQTADLKKELIDAERDFIYQLLRDGKITDEARRRIEYELDLEEAGVANRGKDGGGWM